MDTIVILKSGLAPVFADAHPVVNGDDLQIIADDPESVLFTYKGGALPNSEVATFGDASKVEFPE